VLDFYELGVVTLFGLLIGSFLNVLIIRIPKEESVVFPSSHCVKCGKNLKWYHNIPLFSWAYLGGKCAYCKEKISLQYPLIELSTALLFAVSYVKTGDLLFGFIVGGVFALLLALSMIDFKYLEVPDSLNLLALTLAFASSADLIGNFTNALLFAGGFSFLRFYVSYLTKKEAMGEADIMIAGTIGAMVGVKLGLVVIFLSALLALPVFLVAGKKDMEVPFIPFLALALLIVYIFSDFFQNLLVVLYG
jgi:leader peptidase (prepilin peptidase)/N-methyltransferase